MPDLFDEAAVGVLSYLNDKGQIVAFPVWVEYDGERILFSSPVGSRKGRSLSQRPDVSITVVSPGNAFHYLSISGRVVHVRPDHELEFIDRMSHKYVGTDYNRRTPREVFSVEIERTNTPWRRPQKTEST